jgi:5-methyltetrahydrofolate--homocysteine methyltransferase
MSQHLFDHLLSGAPIVLDGAWGTELQERGLVAGECPDGWNLSHPERVEEVARAYVEAGSQVILTNTFRANRVALASFGLDGKTQEINRAGVEISRRAAAGRAYVFASMGPSGKILAAGDVDRRVLREAFAEQAGALADGGADAIVIETMSDPVEAALAVSAARETRLPVVACMAFDSGKHRDRTMMGTTVEQAVDALVEAGADAVGANCGQGVEAFVAICERLRAATERPIWIKPNAGLPEIDGQRVVYRTSPEEFARFVPALVRAGASFIGGCCGTSPAFVRAIRSALARSA